MKKFKNYLIYTFASLIIIISCASFFADDYASYSSNALFSSTNLYYAFMGNFDKIVVSEPESSKAKTKYVLSDEGDIILKYKEILYYLNFLDPFPENGVFDEKLVTSVKLYQKQKGLEENGELNAATMSALDGEDVVYAQGKSGDEIKNYQRILYYLDYSDETPSGNFTSTTKKAVLAYQKKKLLEETGVLDVATQLALDDEVVIYTKGKKGDEIALYQQLLIDKGYLSGKADGSFGSSTEKAVKAYQKANKLKETGKIDEATKTKMDAEIKANNPA